MLEKLLAKTLVFALLMGFLLSGCSSASKPEVINSSKFGPMVQVYETIIVPDGAVFDGKGSLYDWAGEGDCSQTEGMPPMFKLKGNSVLKNIRMKNAPDGIHIGGSNVTVDNIVNLDVCEDAISIKLDKNKNIPHDIVISNSKFFDCVDKAIQITRGENLHIHNNEFHRCAKAIRVKEKATNIRFENNKVYESKVAIKVTGGDVFVANNLFEGAKIGFWVEQDGRFHDGGGNSLRNIAERKRKTEGGRFVTE